MKDNGWDVAMSGTHNRHTCCRHLNKRHWSASFRVPIARRNAWRNKNMMFVSLFKQYGVCLITHETGLVLELVLPQTFQYPGLFWMTARISAGVADNGDLQSG